MKIRFRSIRVRIDEGWKLGFELVRIHSDSCLGLNRIRSDRCFTIIHQTSYKTFFELFRNGSHWLGYIYRNSFDWLGMNSYPILSPGLISSSLACQATNLVCRICDNYFQFKKSLSSVKWNWKNGPTYVFARTETQKNLNSCPVPGERKKHGYIVTSILRALLNSPILRAFVCAPTVRLLDGISGLKP